jgi:hypothetical protein
VVGESSNNKMMLAEAATPSLIFKNLFCYIKHGFEILSLFFIFMRLLEASHPCESEHELFNIQSAFGSTMPFSRFLPYEECMSNLRPHFLPAIYLYIIFRVY